MGYSRKQFQAKSFDEAAWQKCYHRYQHTYIRLKLACVKSYAEGHTPKQIAELLSLSSLTVRQLLPTCGLAYLGFASLPVGNSLVY